MKLLLQTKLNFFHHRIALDEITRQLKLENVVKDRVFGSFAETLAFLLEALKAGSSTSSKPILITIDHFDLFTSHKKQTLLYNLFDISQSGQTPLSVVGLTSRHDVLELLEKRVKSRFCHRQLYVGSEWTSKEYACAFGEILLLKSDDCGNEVTDEFRAEWNSSVDVLVKNDQIVKMLGRLYKLCREVTLLLDLLMLPVATLSRDHPHVTVADLTESYHVLAVSEPNAKLLHGVSLIELCLVVAMKHLTQHHSSRFSVKLGAPSFNFHEVYNEFLKFSTKKSCLLHSCNKHVVMKAFERLTELEVIKPCRGAFGARGNVAKDYVPMMMLVGSRQVEEAVARYPGCPTDVKRWADSAIM